MSDATDNRFYREKQEQAPSNSLADRLRNVANLDHAASPELTRKAADEIERLQALLALETAALEQACAAPVDAPLTVQQARAGHEPRTPLSDDQLIAIADQFDSSGCAGAIHRYRMRRRDMIALLRSFSATVEGLIRDGAAQPPPESLCPNCEKDEVGTFTADDWFLYGVEKQFRLVAKDVLFFRCMACGLEFTGEDGEQKRFQAVRDHLDRATATKSGEQP